MDDLQQIIVNRKNIRAIVDTLAAMKNEILTLRDKIRLLEQNAAALNSEVVELRKDILIVRTSHVSNGPTV